jgi:hypothetical protein
MFDVCMRFSVFRWRPYDGSITRPRIPTVCEVIKGIKKKSRHLYGGIRGTDKKRILTLIITNITQKLKLMYYDI